MRNLKSTVAIVAATSLAISLAACSSTSASAGSSSTSSPGSRSPGSSTANSAPASSAAASGTPASSAAPSGSTAATSISLPSSFDGKDLVVPAVVGYPPYAFLDGTNIEGIDPDLAMALNGTLGRKVTQKQDSFENALLGLSRGTYFVVMGADITADRMKTYDMVSLLRDYYQFSTTAGHAAIGPDLLDVCGLKISTVAASSSIPVLADESTKCTAAGKAAITTLTFADQGTAGLAVQSGRADATTASVTNLGYIGKQQPGKWKISGPTYGHIFIGAATVKGNGAAAAIAKSINMLIANGEYTKILTKYGVEKSAIKVSEVNPDPASAK